MSKQVKVAIVGYENVWVDYAEVLEEQYNFNIPFIILRDYNNQEHLLLNNKIYLNNILLQKGILPFNVNNSLDEPFLEKLYNYNFYYDLLFDRLEMNANEPKISNFQKQYVIYKLSSFYDYILNEEQLDFIYFSNLPHNIFDFVLYVVCKINNIKTLIVTKGHFSSLHLTENLFEDSTLEFEKSLIEFNRDKSQIKKEVIKNYFDSVAQTSNYNAIKPDYMLEQERNYNNGAIGDLFLKATKYSPKMLFGFFFQKNSICSVKIKYNDGFFTKKRCTQINYFLSKVENYYNKKKLKKLYKKYSKTLTDKDLKNTKYIYFALHYQPEATSLPTGSYFANQLHIIKYINDLLPKEYKLIIKEHPSQLMGPNMGSSGRWQKLYEIASNMDKIIFASLSTNQINLIKYSDAIVTISGTIGFEALAKRKNVLLFGKTWYEDIKGVYRIKSKSDFINFLEHREAVGTLDEVIEECHTILKKSFLNTGDPKLIKEGYVNAFLFYSEYLRKEKK